MAWLTDANGDYILSHGERIVSQQHDILPNFSTVADVTEFLIAVALALLGFGVVFLLDHAAARQSKTT